MNFLFFIQIILESLPISSSHHIKIFQYFSNTKINLPFPDMLFSNVFTLLILIIVFFQPFLRWFVFHSFYRKIKDLMFVSIATFITFLFFVINYIFLKEVTYLNHLFYGCFLNSLLLSSFYRGYKIKGDCNFITKKDAIILGVAQGLALSFSGVSRLGLTLLVGLFLGFSVEYSLAISVALQFILCLGVTASLLFNYCFRIADLNFSYFGYSDLSMAVLSCIISYVFLKLFIHYYIDKKIWYLSIYSFFMGILLLISQEFINI